MSRVGVRYIINDVGAAMRFYTTLLGFTVEREASPAFASVVRDGVRLLLSGDGSSGSLAGRSSPGTGRLEPGAPGSERRRRGGRAAPAAGVSFRTNDVVTGPGGAQIILDDPSGNPVELFQPGSGAA